MSVRSHSRGSPAASSIRLALRTSSIVATRSASFVRWVLRWFGSRRLSSVLRLSAISVMPFMMRFQGPPRAEALNHTPIHQVNNLLAELIDGKLEKLMFEHWTDFSKTLPSKLANGNPLNKEVFKGMFRRVREARNDCYHHK